MITDYLKYVNDRALIVKREVPTHIFEQKGKNELNMEMVKAYRDYLGCNHVLRTQTHFLMCEIIEEAKIIT
tara:strand:- start:299 stop:511 length:213 start_codon:yes stop_codon:yes gene_type:complete